ncbi:MAG: S26 family signal peptidase, partial [Dehalococcoidia bacterium]
MAQTTAATSKPRRRINPFHAGISGAASLLFVAALWILFAPVNLGGKFAYFFVVGNSMQPHITANDLVLLRAADRYDVGDVIGFRDPEL